MVNEQINWRRVTLLVTLISSILFVGLILFA